MKPYIVYEGESMLDSSPIVGIVTTKTTNEKTGQMHQLWILRSDVSPTDAVKTGQDSSVCGDCKHRHFNGGACYVLPFQAPRAIYSAYKKGKYRHQAAPYTSKGIRLGAYGDPAAIPEDVIKELVSNYRFHTGYTHQWQNPKHSWALKYCQASVDSAREYFYLKTMYPTAKTFRVSTESTEGRSTETVCPSESHGMSCIECKLCNGERKDIVIPVHGARKNRFINQKIEVREI